ncbi:MAG: DegT/DnrJ/EryC1/StrS family aminotransferase [Alphaproteobacteria bacterium]|nr:DegT/DnrJ/EryC1/StrS family aminotransferase [Alphaproteobacteria bacterium]
MAPAPILQNDPKASYLAQRAEIDAAIARVLDSGWYILGKETASFEAEFAASVGCGHGVGVGNGTDALVLALRALGIGTGDAVVTVAHTAVASVAAIELAGATPILVDIDPATYTMDAAELARVLEAPPQGARIAAVMPVHLYGQAADLTAIGALARRHGVRLIEDCAQCVGARFEGAPLGSFGDVSCFSFYPTKNLGAFGDGGIVTTRDDAVAADLKAIREYGWGGRRYVSERSGMNTRLDEMQAAILRVKLTRLAPDNARRDQLAARYDAGFKGLPVMPPKRDKRATHIFHQYVLRTTKRDALRAALQEQGIGTNIHYPVPVHLQPAYEGRILTGPSGLRQTEQAAQEILSLPMYPQLGDAAIDRVIAAVAAFFR